MASNHRSIKAVARRERSADSALRKKIGADTDKQFKTLSRNASTALTLDSFVNFSQKLGVGADNALTSSGYGFNPITRVRTTLEWIHRGSWLGGVAIDLVADDMTRAGVDILGELQPDQIAKIDESITTLGVWNKINETIKWSRLYGGCIAVMLIDGQNTATPLRVETIGKNQFKGLLVLDRWMVDPSLNDLVTTFGPELGLPKFYTVTADAPAIPRMKVHHSRVLRLEGIKLPYWQRVMENLWGISILERLYDRMIAFDSATTGAAQLVFKAYLRTYKIDGLREIIAAGGPALNGLVSQINMMRAFQGMEGITLLDGKDEMEAMQAASFTGLDSALTQFGQQLSGALQIPLVRLFGQSPAGFSTGETDMRSYYDTINQAQVKDLQVPVTRIYRVAAQSEGITVPEGFSLAFRSLWKPTEKEKSEIAEATTRTVVQAQEAGLASDKVAMQELKQSSRITGVFTNITEEDIEAASDVPAPPISENNLAPGEEEADLDPEHIQAKTVKARDSAIAAVSAMKRLHDLDIIIEHPKGAMRQGDDWVVAMPQNYGYFRATKGNDGEPVDVFVGPEHNAESVFVIAQRDLATRAFDEFKVMLGYRDFKSALNDYVTGYTDGRGLDRIIGVQDMTVEAFKPWLAAYNVGSAA